MFDLEIHVFVKFFQKHVSIFRLLRTVLANLLA